MYKIPCTCRWRASSVNCLVPRSKNHLTKMKPNTCALVVTHAITMQERTPCCHKNIFLPWDRARHQQIFKKTGLLWNEQFTWFLSFTLYWGWKNVKTIGCEQQNNNCGLFSIANATELEVKHSGKVFPIIVIKFHFDTVPLVILATVTKPRGGKCLKYRSHGQNIPVMQMCAA